MTIVEGNTKVPFSIATTPRCRGGGYSISWINLSYPWYVPYHVEQYARKYQVRFFKSLVLWRERFSLIPKRGSTGESFFFYGLIDFMLFLTLAWRTWVPRVRDIFFVFFTRSTGFWSVCHQPCPITNFSYFLFPLTGRSPHFRFGVSANHLASLFFPLVRRFF